MVGKNNPFNIRSYKKNKWYGQSGSCRGFCEFFTRDYGIRAMCVLIRNYIRNGFDKPSKIISRFAPRAENDTDSYIRFVLDKSGFSDVCLSSEYAVVVLMHFMSIFEGNEVSMGELESVLIKYNIHFDVTGL